MRRKKHSWFPDETGSASLEFIAATVVLLVPLLYLTMALADVQNHSLGADAAARHLARTIARGGDDIQAERVLAAIADEYSIEPGDISVETSCAPVAARCPRPGAILQVRVTVSTPLPLVPAIFGDRANVTVDGTAVQKDSDFIEVMP